MLVGLDLNGARVSGLRRSAGSFSKQRLVVEFIKRFEKPTRRLSASDKMCIGGKAPADADVEGP